MDVPRLIFKKNPTFGRSFPS